ncbi:hypothetical protein LSH36_583g01250 [Paralvinella palmiformis]|uniref:ABC transporter domain-containing protein n=1 Tax=Paralvinella palmiformis TaxID=53620 RepID=A0AAD9J608_9ANNE|nr:hypothetical protein LSH36_583g01250 [Paralvinella palmiformis]
MTMPDSWSTAYGLFTAGETPMVLSYTTSPIYHQVFEKENRYKVALFPEGHYRYVEYVAIPTIAAHKHLAEQFIKFILSKDFQKKILLGNVMYPAVKDIPLPSMAHQGMPMKALELDYTDIAQHKDTWIRDWLSVMSERRFSAIVIIHGLYNFGIIARLLVIGQSHIDKRQYEIGRLLGAKNCFGVIMVLGGSPRYATLEVSLFYALKSFIQEDLAHGIASLQYDFRIAIQCSIEEGSFFSILGPSGAGKSTFLRVLAGLLIPDKGSCIVRGKDILCLAPEKRRIGMVFQDYALFPHMNVYQNIEYGLKVQRRIPAERQKIVTQLLEEFSLTKKALQKPYHLSGGEQQRVALARALAPDPDMLLLDEPLSAVDIYLRDELRSLIKELQRRRKISTFYVTHDRQEALALSDTIAIFKEGRIVQVGSPEDVYTHPHNAVVHTLPRFVPKRKDTRNKKPIESTMRAPAGNCSSKELHTVPIIADTIPKILACNSIIRI